MRVSARVSISLVEAARLVPLIRGQKAAFAELERFDVSTVRPAALFDPREPFVA
jgi:hypothetical protein